MLNVLTNEQYDGWLRYNEVEPFGESRGDLRMGILAATIANFAGKQLRNGCAAKPADYIPRFDAPPLPKQQSDEEMKAVLRNFFG